MKKIIIALILSLSFLSVYADIMIPWQNPCYNDECIDACFKETWRPRPVCKYKCTCWNEKFGDSIKKNKYNSLIKDNLFFGLTLLFVIFPTSILLYRLRKNNNK